MFREGDSSALVDVQTRESEAINLQSSQQYSFIYGFVTTKHTDGIIPAYNFLPKYEKTRQLKPQITLQNSQIVKSRNHKYNVYGQNRLFFDRINGLSMVYKPQR